MANIVKPGQVGPVVDIADVAQPLDSDLTAIAALTTTAFGRGLLELANAGALLSAAGAQGSDATLTALAGANWAANALPIGTGADTLAQTAFAASTFPARASSGNLVAKAITDFGLSLVDDADAATGRATLSAAPRSPDYLVGTADGELSAEIVVGTAPAGELGGTWASPTVDATHSGSTHAGVVATHEAAGDPHTGYRLESADHDHSATGAQAGLVAAATETLRGVAELATAAEVLAGTDATRIVTTLNAFAVFFKTLNVQVFTTIAANTYTPTAGMKWCLVISTGAGGGGGGADGADGTSDTGVGGGGGAGGTCIEIFSAATIGASQTVTLNAVGTAGSATNGTNGGVGGNTTFGALHTAVGGGAGTGSTAINVAVLASAGGVGGYGVGAGADNTVDFTFGLGGDGGASFWGGGGRGGGGAVASLTTDVNTAGLIGIAYGSGGGGAVSLNSTTGAAGGAGANGICVVIEFI
jgi:hypothetical protein